MHGKAARSAEGEEEGRERRREKEKRGREERERERRENALLRNPALGRCKVVRWDLNET